MNQRLRGVILEQLQDGGRTHRELCAAINVMPDQILIALRELRGGGLVQMLGSTYRLVPARNVPIPAIEPVEDPAPTPAPAAPVVVSAPAAAAPSRQRRRFVPAPEGLKHCPRCEQILQLDCFNNNRAARDGKQAYCKPCAAALCTNYTRRKQAERQEARKELDARPPAVVIIRVDYTERVMRVSRKDLGRLDKMLEQVAQA